MHDTEMDMRKEKVKIARTRDAEGRYCYDYSRHYGALGWIQPPQFRFMSMTAAMQCAREDGFAVAAGLLAF